MSTPMSLIARGTFTSAGTSKIIQLPTKIDMFEVSNRSTYGTSPNAVVKSKWHRGYLAGQAKSTLEDASAFHKSAVSAAGGLGFTEIDQSVLGVGNAVTFTGITKANPAVVATATPPAIGSIVRIINSAAMLQIAGLEFEVTAVTASTNFTLGYLDASAFANASTGGTFRVIQKPRFLPRRKWITKITQAANAVITVSTSHTYVAGDFITVYVPNEFGMKEINGKTGKVLSVTASTITTDIDSSAATAFAYPTSAVAAAGVSFPHIVGIGEIATNLGSATNNGSYFGIQLGTDVVGASTNVMDWVALKAEYTI